MPALDALVERARAGEVERTHVRLDRLRIADLGMKPAKVVGRQHVLVHVRHRICTQRGEAFEEKGVGFVEHELHREVVEFLHAAESAAIAQDARVGLQPHHFMLVPVLDVGGRHRHAIRPAQAAAQVEGVFTEVRRHPPAFGKMRHQWIAFGRPAHQRAVRKPPGDRRQIVLGCRQPLPRAAVAPDAIHALEHDRLGADPLRNGRQPSFAHKPGKDRRLGPGPPRSLRAFRVVDVDLDARRVVLVELEGAQCRHPRDLVLIRRRRRSPHIRPQHQRHGVQQHRKAEGRGTEAEEEGKDTTNHT